jgi:hypothetical protein
MNGFGGNGKLFLLIATKMSATKIDCDGAG